MAASSQIVRCRPTMAWLMVVLCTLLGGIGIWSPPQPPHNEAADWIIRNICAVVGCGAAVILALWASWAQVIADERGLRWRVWRIFGGWQTAYWDEVTDFYYQSGNKGHAVWIVETPAGKVRLDESWSRPKAFARSVAERASRARVREWDWKGTRPEDEWPRTFRYDTKDNRRMSWIAGFGALALQAAPLCLTLPKLLRTYGTEEWVWNLASAAMLQGLTLLYAVLALVVFRIGRETRRRFGQTITVDMERIAYDDGKHHIEANWADIVSIYTRPASRFLGSSRHIVETRDGLFDYTGQIENWRLFTRIVGKYGAKAVEAGQRETPDTDDLLQGRVSARPGEQVFHYRNRNARVMLAFPVLLPLIFAFMGWAQRSGLIVMHENASPVPTWVPILFLAPAIYLWWRYRAAQIRIDDFGITQIGALGARTLAWADVQAYYGGGETGFYTVVGSRRKLRIFGLITHEAKLKREIASRATESRNRGWNDSGANDANKV